MNTKALTVTHRLAQYIVDTSYAAIPDASFVAARRFMLDTLAVAWAGSDAPGCREAHALSVDEGGRADSTAWAYGGRLPAMSAAFVNGMTSAALDYDAIGSGASVHVNITVLPAALAMAERLHSSGRDFLAAFVISVRYTIACLLVRRRLGLAEIEEDAAREPEINRHAGKVNVHIDETQTGTRGPIVLRMRTTTHGEISTRAEHVPGSLEMPVTDAEVQQKFDECFRRGARPLDDARIERLTRRVHDVAGVADMSAFFKDIL